MKTKSLFASLVFIITGAGSAAGFPVWLDGPANLATNTMTLPPGWSLIANPLFHLRGTTLRDAVPDNTVGELFKQMPQGALLLRFDNDTHRFSRKNVLRHGRWSDPRQMLAPGEGAFLFNPTRGPLAVSFTGNWWYGALSVPAGLSLIGSPGPGTIDFALPVPPQTPTGPFAGAGVSFNPQEGDVVYTFDKANGSFQDHRFHNGAWDVLPTVRVGEAAFVHTTKPRVIQYIGPRPL